MLLHVVADANAFKEIKMTTTINSKPQGVAVIAASIGLASLIGAVALLAAESDLGKHSQGEIRKACLAAAGTLLGVSDSGSYGCEVASNGTMILCNKEQNCTGYTPARTKADRKRVLDGLNLSVKTTER